MIFKKLIEDPRSLLLNQRSLYSVFLIFDKHNSPKKIRIKTSSIRLFLYKTPATDFPQTKKSRKRFAKLYQRNRLPKFLNSAAWNYCSQKRTESTFNLENKNVFGYRQRDHNCFPTGSAIMQRLQY